MPRKGKFSRDLGPYLKVLGDIWIFTRIPKLEEVQKFKYVIKSLCPENINK